MPCRAVPYILLVGFSVENKCGTQIINSNIPEFNDDFMEFGLISLKIFC